jgi:hypothetical protein
VELKPEYERMVTKFEDSIYVLPSFAAASEESKKDFIWGLHINKQVGCVFCSQIFKVDLLFRKIFFKYLNLANDFEILDDVFDKVVDFFESFFIQTSVEFVRITPVIGLLLQENYKLTETMSLELLSDDDVSETIRYDLAGIQLLDISTGTVVQPCRAAIVTRYTVPKIISDEEKNFSSDKWKIWNKLDDDESQLIDLLALVFEVPITPTGHINKQIDPVLNYIFHRKNGDTGNYIIRMKYVNSYTIDMLRYYIKVYNENIIKKWPSLVIGLRRYTMSLSRKFLDDKLIDLMISAESLFLGDNSELSYRLSLRAAALLGNNQEEKQIICTFFKQIYTLRSKIVHGIIPFTRDSRDHTKYEGPICELSNYIHRALIALIERANVTPTTKHLVEWEKLIFNPRSSTEQ